MKICSKCKEEKDITFFSKNRSKCKECMKKQNNEYNKRNVEKYKKYYQDNRENILNRAKSYYENNKDVILEKCKIYQRENLIEKNAYKNEYRKNKMNTNDLFKLSHTIRSLIANSLRKRKISKKSKTHEILGISYSEFKIYIENQFLIGMSWENQGDWHLDHKTPISWAKTEEEVYKLNYYTNFQPLWAFDNLSKGNKWSN